MGVIYIHSPQAFMVCTVLLPTHNVNSLFVLIPPILQ